MSLDIEGAELLALQGLDHTRYCVAALAVEHNHQEPKRSTVRALLEAASYAYEGEAGFDDYFVKACS